MALLPFSQTKDLSYPRREVWVQLQPESYIQQVNLDIEYFLRHYGTSGDLKFSYYQKA